MGTSFEQLRKLMGIRLTRVVCDKMGGRLVRIRKRPETALSLYRKDPDGYDGMKLESAAELLGCSRRYVQHLRSQRRG